MCIFVCILSADPFLTNPGRIHCYSTRRTTALVSCSRPLSLGGASWHCTVCNVMLLLPKRVIQGCLNGAKPSETAPSMRSQRRRKAAAVTKAQQTAEKPDIWEGPFVYCLVEIHRILTFFITHAARGCSWTCGAHFCLKCGLHELHVVLKNITHTNHQTWRDHLLARKSHSHKYDCGYKDRHCVTWVVGILVVWGDWGWCMWLESH